MGGGKHKRHSVRHCCWPLTLVALIVVHLSYRTRTAYSQTASTGALTGVTMDAVRSVASRCHSSPHKAR